MTESNSPLQRLIDWGASGADDRRGRRVAASWGQLRLSLAGYRSAGEVVRSGWGDGDRTAFLLAELMGLPDADGVALQAALAILAPRLGSVVARWRRSGVPAADLEDMEGELLAAAVEALRGSVGPRPPVPPSPGVLVDWAWAQVRNVRRRHRRAADRVVALDPAAASPAAPAAVVAAAAVVVDGYRSGRLSLPAAQALWVTGVAGWSGADAARLSGCTPEAMRARRSRAIRALAA
jgi:DNA-directed RNA polymerase specialized sigma24 family protein